MTPEQKLKGWSNKEPIEKYWPEITTDEWIAIGDDRDRLIDKLQKTYGLSYKDASNELEV